MIRSQVLKHLPGTGKNESGESNGNVKGERFFLPPLPTEVGSISGVPEGVMAVEVPQNEEISGGAKNGGKKESVLLSDGEERIGGA